MFIPAYTNLNRHLRRLLYATVVVVLAFVCTYIFVLQPERRRCQEFKARLLQKEAELLKNSWPHDPQLLERQLNEVQMILNGASPEQPGLVDTANAAIAQATCTFRKEIRARFDDNVQFMNSVTRIDYKDLYDRITSELSASGIILRDTHFAPAENNQTPIYQQIFKLWTAQLLVQLAKRSQLEIVTENNAAAIEPLPPIGYVVSDSPGALPYLIEFPVKIQFRGRLSDFLAFTAELQNERRFLPLKNITVSSLPPAQPVAGADNAVDVANFTVVCSAFLLPE